MIHKLKVMNLIDIQDKKIKKQLLNFYLFEQNTLIQIHTIYNRKPKILKYLDHSDLNFFGFMLKISQF